MTVYFYISALISLDLSINNPKHRDDWDFLRMVGA